MTARRPLRAGACLPGGWWSRPPRPSTWVALACAVTFAIAPSAVEPPSPGASSPDHTRESALPGAQPRTPKASQPRAEQYPKVAAPAPQSSPRLREGAEIVDRLGRFQVVGDRVVFVAEPGDYRFVVLENLNLERIARLVADRPAQSQWKVSGVVTECRGANFILIRRATLQRPAPLDSRQGGNIMGGASERALSPRGP